MMTVRDLIEELGTYPDESHVYVAVEVVEGHDVRVIKTPIDRLKFEDDDILVELG